MIMLPGLISWVRSRLRPSVAGVWCVTCRSRQTVRRVEVVIARNSKRASRRMIGACNVCGGATSTYIST